MLRFRSASQAAWKQLAAATLWCALGAVLLASGGCAGGNPHPIGTFDRGLFFAEHGKNLEAVGAFENFVRHSPTDSLAAEAQYRKALAYMEMKEYPLAAVELQILRKDYPTSPLVEDALFEEGRAYFLQVGRVERDMTGATEARSHFLRFSQQYPGSPHMEEVAGLLQQISDLMVRKRLEQVDVYRHLKRYASVATVLDVLLEDEAGSTLMPQVMWERGLTAERLADTATAADMYGRLVAKYPDSPFGERAATALARLQKPAAADSPDPVDSDS